MPLQDEKKILKSKKWIDYSSQQDNDLSEQQKQAKQNPKLPHRKLQAQPLFPSTKSQNKSQDAPDSKTVHLQQVPLPGHKKQLPNQQRHDQGDSVWIVLSVKSSDDSAYLTQKINKLKLQKNRQILNIYQSKDRSYAFDLKVQRQLAEKWILEGFDQKGIIELKFRQKYQKKPVKYQPKYPTKYQQKNPNYKPAHKQNSNHYHYTNFQPENIKYKQAQQTKPIYRQKISNHNNGPKQYQQKKKYIEKNPLIEELERKVEQELREMKLQKTEKKEKLKKQKESNFYSKNHFEALMDQDDH